VPTTRPLPGFCAGYKYNPFYSPLCRASYEMNICPSGRSENEISDCTATTPKDIYLIGHKASVY
jgi:hypothetical protein